MEVVINDALMVSCLRLYKLTPVHLPSFLLLLYAALSHSIILPYPPLCLMFIKFNALKCLLELQRNVIIYCSVSLPETIPWCCWRTYNNEKSFLNEILFVMAALGRKGNLFVVFLQLHISILMGHSLTSSWFNLIDCEAVVNPHIVSQDGKGYVKVKIISPQRHMEHFPKIMWMQWLHHL